ncbi:MAG: hypothetical protein ACE15C_01995 [Phycisphaerae bacterium]
MLVRASVVLCMIAAMAAAQEPTKDPATVGIVSHINIVSDKSEDVSSPEAWKKTYIKEGMSDEDKALAIWKTVVKYRHQDGPPDEGVGGGGNVHDPFKTIHVYGYGMCCCAASNIEGLARYIGMPARGRQITAHSVPEVWYDNSWHLLDASLMCYFRNKDGKIASVDEIKASIQDWRKDHPEIKNDTDLKNYSKNDGWKNGPTVLATNLYYDKNGINSAGWHGWWSNVVEYNWKQQGPRKIVCPPDTNGAFNVFDYGPSMGYQLNIQLRDGEKLTRCWGNKGDVLNGSNPQLIKGDRGPLGLQKKFGDNAPGRIGNGTVEYSPPMASLPMTALKFDNLAADGQQLRVKDGAKPAQLIIRMPCSYVYLSGEVDLMPAIGKDGSIAVSISDNHGLDWKEVGQITTAAQTKFDLKKFIRGRYDYRLKFDFTGAGTGLDSLKITDAFQHSQAPLPVILEGDNKVTFSAGPQEGTITYEGLLKGSSRNNLTYLDFHPTINALEKDDLRVGDSGRGDVTFNISTPGDLARIRVNSHYRCRGINGRDYWQVEVSYDGGKTFKPVEKLIDGQPASSKYFTIGDVPAGTKEAQVRFSGVQRDTVCMFDLRMDADYKEPAGGFRPVKVTYVWDEGGTEKKDEHVCKTADDTWTIKCGPKTVAKSYTVELAK